MMHALDPRLTDSMGHLLSLASKAGSSRRWPGESVEKWGWALLQGTPTLGVTRGGRSELNNDGSPLQVCLSSSERGSSVRLIIDPAWYLGVPAERLEVSRNILVDALREAGAGELISLFLDMLEVALPPASAPDYQSVLTRFTRGFFWLGVGVDKPGAAIYMDMQPYGTGGAWDLAELWLDRALPDTLPARRAITNLRSHARLASIGFEGVGLGNARLKLYWRLLHPVMLAELGADLLNAPEFAHFLLNVVGARTMNLSGTVMSLGFDLSSGDVEDAKVDLCGHCLPLHPTQWVSLLDQLCETFGLARISVYTDLLTERCDVAFLGMGVDRARRRRLNLYLKPPSGNAEAEVGENRARAIYEHVDRAITYLVGLQSPDGKWEDYYLPVGRSDQWITGFVGLALAKAAAHGFSKARAAAERAAAWLDSKRSYTAGWGYNDCTGVDADSTAFALRLFRELGHRVQERDETCLLQHWRPEGGFATYQGPDCWGWVHPCVTSTSFLALSKEHQSRLLTQLLLYLSRTARPDGTWPAYWWRSHFYSTYHHMLLLRHLGLSEHYTGPVGALTLPEAPSALELAYALGIEYLRDPASPQLHRLLVRLLASQCIDGSWRGGYDLRVTSPDCSRPWKEPAGELYQDVAGTITTSSVLFVLNEMLHG